MSRGAPEAEVRERDLLTLPQTLPLDVQVRSPETRLASVLPLRQRASRRASYLRAALVLEYERGVLALAVPVALAIGALIYLYASLEPAWTPLLCGLFLLSAIAFVVRNRLVLSMPILAVLLVVIGMNAAKFETWRAGTRVLGGDISTRIIGRVVDIDHLSSKRVRLVLDVLSTERPKLRYQPQRVRVSAASLPAGVASGSIVAGLVRLQPPPGPIRPGSYDFSFESYFDGTGANGFFLGAPKLLDSQEAAPLAVRFRAAMDNVRNSIASRIRAAIGGPEGEIAAALVVGVRAGIPEQVNESLRRTGLAHILSISGLHMALVAAAVMVSLRLGMALMPGFAARYPTKKYAAVAAIIVLAAYLFISGVEVAALRSFIMIAVMLIAVLFDRQALTMRNLAIAAIIVLLSSPHEIIGPSFQMSFAATAALIGGYAIWVDYRRNHPAEIAPIDAPAWRRLSRWVWVGMAGVAATAIIAGVATSIYGIWHFQRVSPFTLIANLAVTPIVSIIVMPFGLLAMLAMPLGLDAPFLAVMGKGLSTMLAVADYLSARSPLDAVGLVPGWTVVLLTVALLIAALGTTRIRLLAAAPLIAGLLISPTRTLPDVLISENALLVGVRGPDGQLMVNRQRPNAFTVDGWARALATSEIVKPRLVAGAEMPPRQQKEAGVVEAKKPERLDYMTSQQEMTAADTSGFRCRGPLCAVRRPNGGVVAVVEDAWTAQQVCHSAVLVVTQQARARTTCGDGRTNIITARELARRGAASVQFETTAQREGSHGGFTASYSIDEPYRPWHANRQFSRAARGMDPYQRQPRRQSKLEPSTTPPTPDVSKRGSSQQADPAP